MTLFPEPPFNTQFLHAVNLLNRTSNSWPALRNLVILSAPIPIIDATEETSVEKNNNPAETALSALSHVSDGASSAGLVSSNEELDEIATSHLKYLLLPFLIASAHADWQGEQGPRLQHLNAASEHLTSFFTAMDRLSLLHENDRERVLSDAVERQTSSPASETREQKIIRFKAEKEADCRLSLLLERAHAKCGIGSTNLKRTSAPEDGNDDTEEVVRDATLVILQSAVRRALDLHVAVQREIPLLQWAERQRGRGVDPRERAERSRPRGPPPAAIPGMPPTFRVVSDREQERTNVFRPSHLLPTYTVEEWGLIEAQHMAKKEQEKKQNEVVAKRHVEEEDSDGDEAEDRDTLEKRRWDDWKDDHNRGSGNTIR